MKKFLSSSKKITSLIIVVCLVSSLFSIAFGDSSGISDSKNALIVSPQYNEIVGFSYNSAKASYAYYVLEHTKGNLIKNIRGLIIDANGKKVLNEEIDIISVTSNYISMRDKNLFGIMFSNGKLLKPVFSSVEDLKNGYLKVTQNGKVGMIDMNGYVIIPTSYLDVVPYKNDFFAVKQNVTGVDSWSIVNKKNVILINSKIAKIDQAGICYNNQNNIVLTSPKCDSVFETVYKEGLIISDNLTAIHDLPSNKWGVLDSKGKVINQVKYNAITPTKDLEGLFKVIEKDKYGYMDKNGKIVIPPMFYVPDNGSYSAGYMDGNEVSIEDAKVNGKFYKGLIDKTGKLLLKPEFDDVMTSWYGFKYCNYIGAKKNKSWSVYRKDGKFLSKVEAGYEISKFSYNSIYVTKNKKSYLLNPKTGKHIQETEFTSFNNPMESTLTSYGQFDVILKDGKSGLINNETAKIVVKPEYKYISSILLSTEKPIKDLTKLTDKDVAFLVQDTKNKVGVVDFSGKKVLETNYGNVTDFKNGIAAIVQNKKIGFINSKYKVIATPKYTSAYKANNGFIAVQEGTKWGYLSTSGKVLSKSIYDAAMPFIDGFAAVKNKGKWGYIDSKGTLVIPCKYEDYTSQFTNNKTPLKMNGKLSILGSKGNMINNTNIVIDGLTPFSQYDETGNNEPKGVTKLKKGKLVGLLRMK